MSAVPKLSLSVQYAVDVAMDALDGRFDQFARRGVHDKRHTAIIETGKAGAAKHE